MPGVASLEAAQYYAHPRNAFWRIMQELFDIDHRASYSSRVSQLSMQPLILWDTLQACYRSGSLDSNIDADGARANDFSRLLRRHPEIRAILFNGATAEKYFKRLVLPQLEDDHDIELLRMPSTSPANAGLSFEQKLAAWRRLLEYID
jgi:hypoxanthine-DNA glycosylase